MLPAAVPGIRQPIQAHHPHTWKQNIMALLGAGGVQENKRMTCICQAHVFNIMSA